MKDKLLEKRDESFIDFSEPLDFCKSLLTNNSDQVILIDAPFGYGKSSFTNILKNEIIDENPNGSISAIKPQYVFKKIETWKFELLSKERIIELILADIFNFLVSLKIYSFVKDEIDLEFDDFKKIKFLPNSSVNLEEFSLSLGFDFAKVDTKFKFKKERFSEIEQQLSNLFEEYKGSYLNYLETFKKFSSEISKSTNCRIVYVFQDCDRCSPDNLITVIDTIHHLNQSTDSNFLVEADLHAIQKILMGKYFLSDTEKTDMFVVKGYIDKIFDQIVLIKGQVNGAYIQNFFELTYPKHDFSYFDMKSLITLINIRALSLRTFNSISKKVIQFSSEVDLNAFEIFSFYVFLLESSTGNTLPLSAYEMPVLVFDAQKRIVVNSGNGLIKVKSNFDQTNMSDFDKLRNVLISLEMSITRPDIRKGQTGVSIGVKFFGNMFANKNEMSDFFF